MKNINNIVFRIKNTSIDVYLFFILFFFLTIKIFILNYHYIEYDELVNLTTYYYKETIFLKNFPNNHLFISLLGIITEYFVGTKIVFFKFLNFLTFPLIIFVLYSSFKNKLLVYFLLLIFLLSDILFDYSYLLRGYYISSLFFSFVFYLIFKNFANKKDINLKLIFIICSFQVINNISSLYLVIPILSAILINYKIYSFNKKFNIFLKYFMSTFILFNLIQILITGLYLENFYDNQAPLLQYVLQNFKDIFYKGFYAIYLKETLDSLSLLANLDILIIDIKNNLMLFAIFLISLLIFLINFFKKRIIIFDYIVIYFFLFFIVINKLPPDRVYVGFVYFFIFYILYFFKDFKFKFSLFNYFLLIIIFLLINFDTSLYRSAKIHVQIDTEKKIKKQLKCQLKSQNLNEIEKHYYYYLYLKNCNKKRNLNEFVEFYRSGNIY